MRFLVDESAGHAVVDLLRDAGHDVLAVHEEMPGARDSDILQRAAGESRVLITNDKDFGDLVFRAMRPHSGVLLLRLRDESPANRARVLNAVLEKHEAQLAGRFTVATEAGVRVRRPPSLR